MPDISTTTTTNMDSENAAFWLPKHFLTDDDFLAPPNHKNDSSGFGFGFGFGLDSSDNDDNNFIQDDDVSFVSHLTRHLARSSLHDPHTKTTTTTTTTTSEMPWLFSTSPQSTLSGFGGGWSSANRSGFSSNGSPTGPSRVPSPPLTPELQNDAAWDLLYEAAGQVARLKMTAIAAQLNANADLLTAPRHSCGFTPCYNNNNNKQYRDLEWAHNCHVNNNNQQRRSCGGGLSQTAWPPLGTRHQLHNHRGAQMRGVYQPVGTTRPVGPTLGVKRPSAGTGVFLPRRVSNSPPRHQHQPQQPMEFRRKPSVMVAARVNMEVEEPNLKSSHLRFPTEHDLMMGRRNVIMGQQRSNNNNNTAGGGGAMMVGHTHEIRLPTDWTY